MPTKIGLFSLPVFTLNASGRNYYSHSLSEMQLKSIASTEQPRHAREGPVNKVQLFKAISTSLLLAYTNMSLRTQSPAQTSESSVMAKNNNGTQNREHIKAIRTAKII